MQQQQTAVIKVLCRIEHLTSTANLLEWAVGHHVEVDPDQTDDTTRCLLIFTDIAYYENDETILERLGLNIVGKIKGVVSWEVVPRQQEMAALQNPGSPQDQTLEADLTKRLRQLPIAISIMQRNTGKYAWKCLEAGGYEDTFALALEAALTHFTTTYKFIREELMG